MAVYTDVTDEALADFLKEYDVGTILSFKGIAEGVENTNYLLKTTSNNYILTLYEKRVKREDLPFFLELKQFLAANGLSCPQPIANKEDEILSQLAGRPAALISFLEGVSIRRPTTAHCRQLGQVLAKLHTIGQRFTQQRSNNFNPPHWQDMIAKISKYQSEYRDIIPEDICEKAKQLGQEWQDQTQNLPLGIIHADLFPDNVFFIADELSGLIDFYFACNDVLFYDVAICLNAWCFEQDCSYNLTKGQALLQGYRENRRISEVELATLPFLARCAAMRFYLTRTVDWLETSQDALVTRKDPREYIRKFRFHENSQSSQFYA